MIPRVLSGRYLTGNNLINLYNAKEYISRTYRWSVGAGHGVDVANEEAGGDAGWVGRGKGFHYPRQAGLSRAVSGLSSGGCVGGTGYEPAAGQDEICAWR